MQSTSSFASKQNHVRSVDARLATHRTARGTDPSQLAEAPSTRPMPCDGKRDRILRTRAMARTAASVCNPEDWKWSGVVGSVRANDAGRVLALNLQGSMTGHACRTAVHMRPTRPGSSRRHDAFRARSSSGNLRPIRRRYSACSFWLSGANRTPSLILLPGSSFPGPVGDIGTQASNATSGKTSSVDSYLHHQWRLRSSLLLIGQVGSTRMRSRPSFNERWESQSSRVPPRLRDNLSQDDLCVVVDTGPQGGDGL